MVDPSSVINGAVGSSVTWPRGIVNVSNVGVCPKASVDVPTMSSVSKEARETVLPDTTIPGPPGESV